MVWPMENPIVYKLIYFLLNFSAIFFQLLFFSILGWVICSWLVLFGILGPGNKFFQTLGQIVEPVLRPFRWARIGMLDLSPIVAILVLDFLVTLSHEFLTRLMA